MAGNTTKAQSYQRCLANMAIHTSPPGVVVVAEKSGLVFAISMKAAYIF
jgi:hypothetical protein